MAAPSPAAAPDFDLNGIFHLLLEKIWLIIFCIVFFLGLAIAYIFLATPKYDAITTIEVLQKQHPLVNLQGDQPDDYRSLDVLETVEGNLERTSLLLRVLQTPEAKKNIFLSHLAADPDSPENISEFNKLQDAITVKLRRATRLIDLTVEHRDPETAQLLANLLVQEYIQEGYSNQSEGYQNTSDFLDKEAQRMKEKLQVTETQLQDYAKLVDLRQRILDERKQVDLLDQRYLEKHPKVIEAHELLADLQRQFLDEMARRQAADPSQAPAPAAGTDEAGLTDDQKVEREMIEEQSQYNVITQEEATARTMYESVLDRLKESGLSQGYQDANIRAVEPALLPHSPAKPKVLLCVAIGLFLGLSTGFGSALALSFMNTSFKTVDEAEGRLDLPALGAIPEFIKLTNWRKRGDNQAHLIIKDDRDSMVAETIRTLRASIRLLGRHQEGKSLLFTSAAPEEGKSFVTSNLAISLAQDGSQVLLVDADLRRPTQHHIFDYPRHTPGLGEYLSGQPLAELLIAGPDIPGLSLLFAGGALANPAELLSNGRFQKLLSGALKQYDYILVDSAPIHAVGDTLLLCEFFQIAILVIRAGKTPAAASVRAINLLQKAGAHVSGFVLNRLPTRSGFGYNPYHYHYQSSDKYGDAYGAAKKK